MATRSVELARAVIREARGREFLPIATIENPLPRSDPSLPSAFFLPEVANFCDLPGVEFADFNTCAYGPPLFKPQRFVGVLSGLGSLRRDAAVLDLTTRS